MLRKYKDATSACTYLVVWCPKFLRPVLTAAIADRLRELLLEDCQALQVEVDQLTITPAEVRLVVTVPPQLAVHRLVRHLKGHSSAVLRREFPALRSRLPTLWTHAYFVTTVGVMPADILAQYVAAQKFV